ncbi:MAG: hypothetical protein AB1896_19640 [Thermodesulfobacteriota bacterium]
MGLIMEPLFGSMPEAPAPQPLPPMPEPPKLPEEMTPEEREAEKKRKAAALAAARNPTLLTAGLKLGEPQIGRKSLLGG